MVAGDTVISVGVRRYGGMVFQMGGRMKLRW